MSGGSYDYVSYRFHAAADELRSRHSEPHVIALSRLLDRIGVVMHDIEWADSCDTAWNDALDKSIRSVITPGDELTAALDAARIANDRLSAAIRHVEGMTDAI
ncbi:MAG: hypothetical protein HEQ38_17220 [Gemmatimonas sp.]|nr:hypothetical protein [Gemmatimonas sp.]